MKNLRSGAVKMAEPQSRIKGNIQPLLPDEGWILLQPCTEVASWEQLVDEVALLGVSGEAHQYHQVWMSELTENLYFLTKASFIRLRQDFYRYLGAVSQCALVNGSICALP
jgi:hypothetical protein